jgi:nitroimidazol reductase NimA-like FMN-containing flavoprotein (pyridoxamine 5'-phosphate oxidase superfamily)
MTLTADVDDRGHLFELDRAACLALLGTQHVGRLVVGGAEAPHVVVVNYVVHRENVVFRSDPGQRAAAAVESGVAFEVDMYDERTRSGWSVVVRGTARDVTSSVADDEAVQIEPWAPGPKSCWIAVPMDEVTGRLLRGEAPPTWRNPKAYM